MGSRDQHDDGPKDGTPGFSRSSVPPGFYTRAGEQLKSRP